MLTRHLYEFDEVISALQLSLLDQNKNGLFWFWELVVSDETDIAKQTVLDMWFLRGGCIDPDILDLGSGSGPGPELYTRVENAIRIADVTVQKLLKDTSTMESRPNMTPIASSEYSKQRRIVRSSRFIASVNPLEFSNISQKNAIQFWISLDAACRQGNRVDAIWLLQVAKFYLSDDGIWSALMCMCRNSVGTDSSRCTNVLTSIRRQQTKNTNSILYQANAVLYLCFKCSERDEYDEYDEYDKCKLTDLTSWNSWNSLLGRRAARLFEIPRESLTHNTTRGKMPQKYTNISELRNPIPHLEDGCRYWKNIQITDDTYDIYFPDDIPDEWSTLDQQKSHGRGCQETLYPDPITVTVREKPVLPFEWVVAICVRP